MVSPLSAISVQRPFFCPFLYYGLPGQTMASLKETLTRLCTTGIEHLSVYGLIVEDGTPLQKMTEAGLLDIAREHHWVTYAEVEIDKLHALRYADSVSMTLSWRRQA